MIVISMGADPEPDHVIIDADGNSSVIVVNSRRPISSNLFETQ
ncbi:hypothetical protein X743_24710 [Mesorhizobium sp. LNHC252B00]|nr:hypothetical protein X743_24710 [Mesorhizobium sp. LNHC252B00]